MPSAGQQWLDTLKVALIEKNTTLLGTLIETVPSFSNKEAEVAHFLAQEVVVLLQTLQDEARVSMQQIDKSLQFLRATERPKLRRLDITS